MCLSNRISSRIPEKAWGGLRRTKMIQVRHPPASLSSTNGDKPSVSDEKGPGVAWLSTGENIIGANLCLEVMPNLGPQKSSRGHLIRHSYPREASLCHLPEEKGSRKGARNKAQSRSHLGKEGVPPPYSTFLP